MYRVHLTEEQRDELQRRTRAPGLMRRTRDRLEMVRLADAGMSIPQIAWVLRADEQRVRHWIKRFLASGFDALPDQPHRGQQSQLTPELVAALKAEIAKGERSWTAPQLAEWLVTHHGLRLSAGHLATLLRRAGLVYRRTERTLKHRQDPDAVAAATDELRELEKGEPVGAWMLPT